MNPYRREELSNALLNLARGRIQIQSLQKLEAFSLKNLPGNLKQSERARTLKANKQLLSKAGSLIKEIEDHLITI